MKNVKILQNDIAHGQKGQTKVKIIIVVEPSTSKDVPILLCVPTSQQTGKEYFLNNLFSCNSCSL